MCLGGAGSCTDDLAHAVARPPSKAIAIVEARPADKKSLRFNAILFSIVRRAELPRGGANSRADKQV